MFTHSLTPALTTQGGQVTGTTLTLTAGAERNIDEPIPIGATNLPVAFNLIVAKCVSFWVSADQALALKFNSSGTPAPLLTLLANQPYYWATGYYDTFKLTVDITALFVTNASGVAATLKIRALEDPT